MYDYRRQLWKRLILWLLTFAAAVTIGLGVGIAVGRYYFPNVEPWDVALEDARVQAESDYYRGVMSACVGIGMQMMLPSEGVAATCGVFWQMAYQNDWYTELDIESWQFPPETSGGK